MAWKDFFLGLFGGTESNNGAWTVTHIAGRDNKGTVTVEWKDPDAPEVSFSITREGEYTTAALTALVALAIEERDKWARSNVIKAQIANEIEGVLNEADPGPNMEG